MIKKHILIDDSQCATIELFFNGDIDDFTPIEIEKDFSTEDFKIEIIIRPALDEKTKAVKILFRLCLTSKLSKTLYETIAYNLYDFIDGIYAEFIMSTLALNYHYFIKLYNKKNTYKYLLDKSTYLEERVSLTQDYVYNTVYDKSLVDDLERMDLLYVLLLNKINTGKLLYHNKDILYLKDKLSYYGYDDVEPKPKYTHSLDDKFKTLMYYVTSDLLGKGRKPKLDKSDLILIYKDYIIQYINKTISEEEK